MKMTRAGMVDFLKNHFRYDTMNSNNCQTSYAVNVKVRGFVPHDLQDNAYSLLETDGAMDDVNDIIRDFDAAHNYEWQGGFNGRSNGYIVLYRGERVPSGYKSRCTYCYQLNYKTTEETGKDCGVCHRPSRVNFTTPHMTVNIKGTGTDMGEDFTEWDIASLRDRVKLVKEFDAMVEDCKAAFIELCKTHTSEEETVMVPKKIRVLKKK